MLWASGGHGFPHPLVSGCVAFRIALRLALRLPALRFVLRFAALRLAALRLAALRLAALRLAVPLSLLSHLSVAVPVDQGRPPGLVNSIRSTFVRFTRLSRPIPTANKGVVTERLSN